jgi:peptidoglycan/xylan/chitin deacetylase (PgdA/CDA1 family)
VPLSDIVQAMRQSLRPDRMVALTFDDGYRDFLTHALPVLEANGCPSTVFVVSGLLGGTNGWDAGYLPSTPLLTAAEVRELADRGVDIGSHSSTHAHLTRLTKDELDLEIEGSRSHLEALIGRRVRWFAYPFLDQNPTVREAVRAAGFEAAFGGEQAWHEQFAIHRISVGKPSPALLDIKLRGLEFKILRALNRLPLQVGRRSPMSR